MVKVEKLGILLEPTQLNFERTAVLNPGVYQDGDLVHVFYRAIDRDHQSSIGYARLKGPDRVLVRKEQPVISPEYDYESKGVEDPRITKIDDTFYLTYVAHDGKNAVTAYATSSDLKTFEKKGVISPQITYHRATEIFSKSQLKDAYAFYTSFYEENAGVGVLIWEKDVLLFPKKINGQFAMIHRILPDMQIVFFNDFKDLTTEFWEDYLKNLAKYVILENKHWFETRNIGGGCPPIETEDGWLLIYHAVEARNQGRVYHASAALLDKENPQKVIGKLHEPLFSPVEDWEKSGFVSNVVFPTGSAQFGDTLYIYYGAADKRVCVASVSMSALLKELQDPTLGHNHGKEQK